MVKRRTTYIMSDARGKEAAEPAAARAAREVDRIREVYRAYMPSVRRRWDPSNRGNRAIAEERSVAMRALLGRHGFLPLSGRRVVDVGCGSGDVLGELMTLGAEPGRCLGIDLLPERVAAARRRFAGMEFATGDGAALPLADASVDLALVFTLFSSILDADLRQRVANEIARVLGPSGGLLWYDLRYPSPANPHVRGMARGAIQQLFPAFALEGFNVTLLPPLARRLGRLTGVLYPLLAGVPALRSHYVGLLRRRPQGAVHR